MPAASGEMDVRECTVPAPCPEQTHELTGTFPGVGVGRGLDRTAELYRRARRCARRVHTVPPFGGYHRRTDVDLDHGARRRVRRLPGDAVAAHRRRSFRSCFSVVPISELPLPATACRVGQSVDDRSPRRRRRRTRSVPRTIPRMARCRVRFIACVGRCGIGISMCRLLPGGTLVAVVPPRSGLSTPRPQKGR